MALRAAPASRTRRGCAASATRRRRRRSSGPPSAPGTSDFRRYLLAECLEAYADLDAGQKERLEALLTTEPYAEVKPIMITTYERGKIAERRESVLLQLEAKFGPLSPAVRQRVEALSPEELRQLQLDLVKAASLKELRLED